MNSAIARAAALPLIAALAMLLGAIDLAAGAASHAAGLDRAASARVAADRDAGRVVADASPSAAPQAAAPPAETSPADVSPADVTPADVSPSAVPQAEGETWTWAIVPASATGPDTRGAFEYIAEPGMELRDQVAVRNFGDAPITLTLQVRDAGQTPENEFDLEAGSEQSPHVGSWLTLDAQQVTVEARSFTVVPFSFAVPLDAEPGDHAGGVIAVNEVDPDGAGTFAQYAVGVRVHVRVAGPVEPGLRIDAVTAEHAAAPWAPFGSGDLGVTATMVNDGNVRLTPTVTVEATGLFGWWSQTTEVTQIAEILPDGATSFAVAVTDVPRIGPIWVTVRTTSAVSGSQDLSAAMELPVHTIMIWSVPWVLLIAVVLLIVAGALAVYNLRRRRRARADE